MYILDKRNSIRIFLLGVAILLALPFNFGKLTGFSNWFSPFLQLNSVIVSKSLVTLNLIGFVILVVSWFKSRFFCKFICPVGCSFDIVSKCCPAKKRRSISNIPNINKWLAIISLGGAFFGFSVFLFLDPLVIFNDFFVSFIPPFDYFALITLAVFPALLFLQLFFPGLWCEKICPSSGLQLSISELKKYVQKSLPTKKENDLGRRLFLGGTLGILAGVTLPYFTKNDTEPVLRPPGSIETNLFNTLCIRCGSCIKVCPTKILKHDTRVGLGLLTPVLLLKDGYCLESCNSCSVVCPSGAITHFPIESKKLVNIGRANVTLEKCLLVMQKECGICKPACHYDAINIVYADSKSINMIPEVNNSICNGCGACQVICPENCIKIEAQ